MMLHNLHAFAVAEASHHFAINFIDLDIDIAVLVLGFIAAVTIGSIAWYNSKRPTGWEDKERPDIVPKVDKDSTPGTGEPKS